MYDYSRLRFVAANYASLQGLRSVPLALWLILMGYLQVAHIQSAWMGAFSLGTFALALALYLVIGVYYRRTFGAVTGSPQGEQKGRLAVLIFMGVFLVALALEAWLQPPVFLESLAVMALFVAYWWAYRPYRLHWLLVGLAAGVFSFFPLFAPALRTQTLGIFNLSFGVLWLILSLGDHLILVRSFAPVAAESQEAHV